MEVDIAWRLVVLTVIQIVTFLMLIDYLLCMKESSLNVNKVLLEYDYNPRIM